MESFAKIAHPLYSLTRKNASFCRTEERHTAFKEKVVQAPVPKRFVVETDASLRGLGAVVSQTQSDGNLHPIAYASRSLNPGEHN